MADNKYNNAKGIYWNAPRGVMAEQHSNWYIGQINIADREEFCKWLMQQPTDIKGGVPLQVTKGVAKKGDNAGKEFTSVVLDTKSIEWSQKQGNNQPAVSQDDSDGLPF